MYLKNKKILFLTLVLYIVSCTKHYHVESTNFTHSSFVKEPSNQKTDQNIAPYKHHIDSATNSVIAIAENAITKDGDNCALGNFCCDAMLFGANKVFGKTSNYLVILNKGGLRINLPKGEIKVKTIFELMPFENEMVQVEIKGSSLLKIAGVLAEKHHPFAGFNIIEVKSKLYDVTINNVPIDTSQYYPILTSDYLLNGGDGFLIFNKAKSVKKSTLKIRDVFIDYCKSFSANNSTIKPYTDGRLQLQK